MAARIHLGFPVAGQDLIGIKDARLFLAKKTQNLSITMLYSGFVYFGAPEGTRTHTLKAREPKSRMSTNSITGAYSVPLRIAYKARFKIRAVVSIPQPLPLEQ